MSASSIISKPESPVQKFHHGDMVRIADDLGQSMSHFTKGINAIVDCSYAEKFGNGQPTQGRHKYSLIFCTDGNQCSWYYESQLTFIRHVGQDGINDIRDARKKREAVETDLNWIIANWPSIRERPPSATMGALMGLVGIADPWGARGEGVTLYRNTVWTWELLDPILSTGDSDAIKAFLKDFPKTGEEISKRIAFFAISQMPEFKKAIAQTTEAGNV